MLVLLLLLLLCWPYNPFWVLTSSMTLLHRFSEGFVTINFSEVGSLAPRPTPYLEDQVLHFVWPLPFDLHGMGGPTRSLHSRQHSFPGRWGAQTPSPLQGDSLGRGISFTLFTAITSRRMRSLGHIACVLEMKTAFNILVHKPQEKRTHGIRKLGCKNQLSEFDRMLRH
jgi:hypothetical protein